MSYRNKLFLLFNIVVFVSVSAGVLIIYSKTHRLVTKQIRSELLSTALIAAQAVNGDIVKTFTTESSTKSAVYEALVERLRWIRDANRRSDFYVKYVYLLSPPDKNHNLFYLLDVDEDPNIQAYYHEILDPQIPSLADIKGPVLVGSTIPGFDAWGAWISAYVPIYDSSHKLVGVLGMDAGAKHTETELRTLLFFGLGALLVSLIASTSIAFFLSKTATRSLKTICHSINRIGLGDFSSHVQLDTHDEFEALGKTVNEMADGLAQKERLTKGFSRYVSHHVLETILQSTTPTKLEGEKRKVTVMFSDIRHFTKMSEHLPPEKVVSFLNEYFEKMISIIFSCQGTLDKFIGDGIMAEFGMPLRDPLQELHAIKAAVAMQNLVKTLSVTWEQKGLPPIKIGIGIHSGEAIVGTIGSDVRMEYTAVGDTVYVASGLEGQTKVFGEEIIISEEVYKQVCKEQEFSYKDLGLLYLQEREHPIRAYAVITNPPVTS